MTSSNEHESDPMIIIDPTLTPKVADRPVVSSAPPSRSGWLEIIAGIVVASGLAWLVLSGGDGQGAAAPPTTVPPTTVPPTSGPIQPPEDPSVSGDLRDGNSFEVYEQNPGVLCVRFTINSASSRPVSYEDTCHQELVTASGAAVIGDVLVFGYLSSGTSSASIRYRSGPPRATGVRVEPNARFFALPLRADDPYRIQYRTDDFSISREVPLVALRGGTSQTADAAARDGVPTEIAELAFRQRIGIQAEWTAFAEGPLIWSRLPNPDDGPADWGELIRLDLTGTIIERSVPLPGIELTAQVARPGSLYFIGEQRLSNGDTAVALVRIDRTTGEHLVRLFPQPSANNTDNNTDNSTPELTQPNWQLGPALPGIDVARLAGLEGGVQLELLDGSSRFIEGSTLLPQN